MRYNHPTDIPMSKFLFFDWIGERIPTQSVCVKGDTYPVTWADDDALYVGVGDPNWYMKDGRNCILLGDRQRSDDEYRSVCGQVFERITGGAERFEVERIHDFPGYIGGGGSGPKPCGMICVEGKLYYAVQNLLGMKPSRFREKSQHGSDATILMSEDYGRTWAPDLNDLLSRAEKEQFDRESQQWKTPPEERNAFEGWTPMFPGSLFGGPSFVQFGKNNADAVDGYVYAVSGDHWDNGRELRLGRVPNGEIMDRAAWEFAIPSDGEPEWVKDLAASEPILSIDRHISLPEMVYIKSLNRYLLLTWALHTDFRTPTGSELTVLESPHPWGPFSLVHYEWMWYKRDCCAYTPRVPLKWFDQTRLEGYMLFSGNWETQYPYYVPQVMKFGLTVRTDDLR